MSTFAMYFIANIIVLWPPPVPTTSKLPSPKIWGRVTSPQDASGGGSKNINITRKIICRLYKQPLNPESCTLHCSLLPHLGSIHQC